MIAYILRKLIWVIVYFINAQRMALVSALSIDVIDQISNHISIF